LNKNQYIELCKYCDEILQEDEASQARIAIPWLHVIRPHPTFLSQYEGLFTTKFLIIDILRKLFLKKIYELILLVNFLKIFRRYNGICIDNKDKKCENNNVLFISHLTNLNSIGLDEDTYFGALPKTLKKQGYFVIIALINHTGKSSKEISKYLSKRKIPKIILLETLNFRKEWEIYKEIIKEKSLLKDSLNKSSGLKSKILRQAIVEINKSGTSRALRIRAQVKELVEQYNIKNMVTTYEGHSWERLAFLGAREGNSSINCIGYMHAPLFNYQHSLLRDLKEIYNPTHVWTVNSSIADFLSCKIKCHTISIGSNKHKAIKYSCDNKLNYEKQKTCLVIPEGIKSECEKLFDFSLSCAIAEPSINFIWRLHPLISFSDLVGRSNRYKKLPKNITLSEGAIDDDISKSNYVLYRGSSAIIECILGNLIPIYLDFENEITIDPLYQIKKIITVKTIDEYVKIVSLGEFIKKENLKILKEYCRNYHEPLNLKISL